MMDGFRKEMDIGTILDKKDELRRKIQAAICEAELPLFVVEEVLSTVTNQLVPAFSIGS